MGRGHPSGRLKLGELRYRSDRSTEVITLENGAVITRQEGSTGSAMLAEPRWFCDDDPIKDDKTFVIYIMNVTAGERMAKSGMTTVRMQPQETNTTVHNLSPQSKVTVTYTKDTNNDHSVAWKNYLTSPMVGMRKASSPLDTQPYEISDVDKLRHKRV
ncbi:MAG: hypothetical protein RQM90_08740 [Methanoculleus sp.]